MQFIIDAVLAAKENLPKTKKSFENYPSFRDGFVDAVKTLTSILATDQEIQRLIECSVINDVRCNLETKSIHLKERIAVIQRDANKLASSGRVKESEVRDRDAHPLQRELSSIATTIKQLESYLG